MKFGQWPYDTGRVGCPNWKGRRDSHESGEDEA